MKTIRFHLIPALSASALLAFPLPASACWFCFGYTDSIGSDSTECVQFSNSCSDHDAELQQWNDPALDGWGLDFGAGCADIIVAEDPLGLLPSFEGAVSVDGTNKAAPIFKALEVGPPPPTKR